ncbi:kinase/pyrophosphorylase [Atopobium sp. oral taxon 810]|uniref:kinase/pyrophosphorylase n=1 Tax=Atopobium sp. oral taxon 810 TaxID=712158 RepID=UPI00039736AE|nr:kinase/pyrophosphorylase [Atopobium sp. oral taxon 810]ERI05498.1 hypothetical protein HMPREF9069_00816 [Atopobium sp. oral taxon 810 str. F0209]
MSATQDKNSQELQQEAIVVHVISDSLGKTATAVVEAAAVQFVRGKVQISCLSHVTNIAQFKTYLKQSLVPEAQTVFFHTILDPELRRELQAELAAHALPSVDLLGPAMTILSQLLEEEPLNIPGLFVERESCVTQSLDARTLA